jgi:hypothetical protein
MNPSQWEYPQSSFNGRVEKGDSSSKLVRIQRRVSRKRYLNSKRVYEYERVSLHIPRKYHETIKPFLDKDWQMEIVVQNGSLIIMLLPKNPSEIRSLKAFK